MVSIFNPAIYIRFTAFENNNHAFMQQQKHIKTCSIPILRKARLLKSFCSVNKGDTSIWDKHQSYEFAYISTNRFWTVRTRTVYASHI